MVRGTLLVGCLIWIAGCGSSDGKTTLIGHVWGMAGSIEGVDVTGGDASASSDADGRFLLEIPAEGLTVIGLARDGYAPAYHPVAPGGASQVTLIVFLHESTYSGTVDVTAGPDTVAVDDLTLEFPAGSLRTASGDAPDGPVDVTVTWLGRVTPSMSPVPLLGRDEDGATWPMISYGMFDLQASWQGEACTVADGAAVTVRVPAQAGDETAASMFSVDTNRGMWIEQSPAIREGDAWVGALTHLSWWNVDLFLKVPSEDWACIVFRARTPSGAPIEGMTVRSAPGEKYPFAGSTDKDGDLCNERFPADTPIEAQWGTFLSASSDQGVMGTLTFTPTARGARCGKPACQVVEIPVACTRDDQCAEGRRCIDGECNQKSDGGDITGSCLYPDDTCNQFGPGFREDNVRDTCSQGNGTFSQDPCPAADEVGRCRYNQGTLGEVETVYYAPTYTGLEADLKDGCENVLQGLWIPAG